jgi:hypothetical protein
MSKKTDFLSKKIWHCQRDSYKENVIKSHPEWNEGSYAFILFDT